ncbi:MAG: TetR/AcrR family transcriptional regulator [Candidatus Aminicenantes bacterium]|nr:MAG: TetR/AcrR family transcriptional regulator [Candidatus Aminicenantes bacterium]
MPLKTFMNLDEERQKEIIDACLKEFALRNYNEVSLSKIIAKLGLAKGSFYRYFESKKDLYAYLINYAKKLNVGLFEKTLKDPTEDIFNAWARFYLQAAKLDNEYPAFGGFGYKVAQERDNVVLGNVALKSKMRGIEVLRELFEEQQKKGNIRKDLDINQMIYTLMQVQEGVVDYLALKYKINFEKNIQKGKPLFAIPEDTLRKELEAFARILREGMGL